jgi:hypothetical protein
VRALKFVGGELTYRTFTATRLGHAKVHGSAAESPAGMTSNVLNVIEFLFHSSEFRFFCSILFGQRSERGYLVCSSRTSLPLKQELG